MPSATSRLAAAVLCLAPCAALSAQGTKPAIPTMGTLSGVVFDSAGKPMRGAEVVIPALKRSVRSDVNGDFTLDSIAPGKYEVWVRNLGYAPAQFDWPARANTRIEVSVKMSLLPHTLDPVEVWASEEKAIRRNSVVKGFVVDSSGNPVEGAEVALLGTGRVTLSGADGSFSFRHTPDGNLSLRSRFLGYTPSVSRFKLLENDDRTVYLRMTALPQTLDAVNVTERSGYGPVAVAWEDFDQRQRWRGDNAFAFSWGEEDLAKHEAQPLDLMLKGRLPQAFSARGVTSMRGGSEVPRAASSPEGDVCILENGYRFSQRPLRAYDASQLETLEFYPAAPPETEFTRTLAYRFAGHSGCEVGPMGQHPAWYVLWFKGAR